MNRRMTMVTAVVGLALAGLTACGSSADSEGATPDPSTTTTSATPSPSRTTPSVDPSTKGAIKLRGDWQDTKAKWIVHFHEDGTFVEDFQGQVDFRVGKYSVDGSTVSLIGDDGNTDKGAVKGDTLVFRLGTLTRM
jgi:glucose/arabinose dehydrogenase